jgi:hypothetical protein
VALIRALHRTFHDPESASYRVTSWTLWALIVVSLGLFGLDLYLPATHPFHETMRVIDDALLVVFALEAFLRVLSYRPPALDLFAYSAPERLRANITGRISYCFTPLMLVDILTVLALVPAMRGLRALRILRLLRTAKFSKYSNPFAFIFRTFEENSLLFALMEQPSQPW